MSQNDARARRSTTRLLTVRELAARALGDAIAVAENSGASTAGGIRDTSGLHEKVKKCETAHQDVAPAMVQVSEEENKSAQSLQAVRK